MKMIHIQRSIIYPHRIFILLSLLAVSLTANSVLAQSATPPNQTLLLGKRVRISNTAKGPKEIGTIMSVRGDTIGIHTIQQDTITAVTSTLKSIEYSQGRKRQWKLGAIVGASLTAGAILLKFHEDSDTALGLSTLGLGAGSLWGALIGSLFFKEKWIPIKMIH